MAKKTRILLCPLAGGIVGTACYYFMSIAREEHQTEIVQNAISVNASRWNKALQNWDEHSWFLNNNRMVGEKIGWTNKKQKSAEIEVEKEWIGAIWSVIFSCDSQFEK